LINSLSLGLAGAQKQQSLTFPRIQHFPVQESIKFPFFSFQFQDFIKPNQKSSLRSHGLEVKISQYGSIIKGGKI